MAQSVEVLPRQGHESEDGLSFRQVDNQFGLQPVEHFNYNDNSVSIDKAEQVIRAVCKQCGLCTPQITRKRALWGLVAAVAPSDLRISGAQVPSNECKLRTGMIPDSQFR